MSKPREPAVEKPAVNCQCTGLPGEAVVLGSADQASLMLFGAPSSTHTYQNLQAQQPLTWISLSHQTKERLHLNLPTRRGSRRSKRWSDCSFQKLLHSPGSSQG